ncbi:MAG: hypothetical protein ISS19_13165 [Bacteroidales bacterium]|nr:hypothetical protein [Bacteroidales bacterium]
MKLLKKLLLLKIHQIHFNVAVQRPWISIRAVTCVVVLVLAQSILQGTGWSKQTLNRGKLWATLHNSLQYGDPTEIVTAFHGLDYPGYSKGPDIQDALNYIGAGGYAIYGVRNGVEYAYSLDTRYFPSGEDVFPVEEMLMTTNYNLENPEIKGEQVVAGSHYVYGVEVEIRRTSRVWSYPKYDDFIIHEVEITNKKFSNLTDLYFGMRYSLLFTVRSMSRKDEKYGWDGNHNLFYFYDDWSFNWEDESPIQYNFGVGPEKGDIGDSRDIKEPNSKEHEFDAPAYFTAIVLDSVGSNVYQNILEYGSKSGETNAPDEDRIFIHSVDEPARFKEVMSHQQPRMSWDEARDAGGEGGNKYERSPIFLLSVGPFSLAPYERIKIVFAEVMGEMDRARIVEGGIENLNILSTVSYDSLMKNVAAAKQLYSQDLLPEIHPPPTPTNGENSLTITSEPGYMIIEWPEIPDTYLDPILNVNDFEGYRIYRSAYFTIGPWDLLVDIPKSFAEITDGIVYYEDRDVSSSIGYYYMVTTYDNDGNESGKVNNNRFPVYPTVPQNEEFPRNVYVVPNPFRQHSGLYGTGERYRIQFLGLPGKAKIEIYTTAGDLVQKIEHNDGTGSAAWGSIANLDYQLTKWALGVAPGIYIYLVESMVPGHEGESYIGKMAIIK